MKKIILPILLIFLVISISGCIDWPDGKDEYEDDVIIIFKVTLSPPIINVDQTASLLVYVKNIGTEKVGEIQVKLYDYGQGIFDVVKVKSGCIDDKKIKEDDIEIGCKIELIPGETKIIEWNLDPSDIKLTTYHDLGISVEYPFKTTGLSTVHFISQSEYQRQLREGTYVQKFSEPTLGEGPIKAYFKVQNPEPIPVEGNEAKVSLTLELQNKGTGDLIENLILKSFDFSNDLSKNTENCADEIEKGKKIELIKGKRSLPCVADGTLDFEKELTKKLKVEVSYSYRVKKEMKITVNPK